MRKRWTYLKLKKEAKKYASRGEFQNKSKGAYLSALRKKILNDICSHMKRPVNHNKIWFKENCEIEAKKYITRSEFSINSRGAYKAAIKEGWLNDICSHMIKFKKPNNYWTKKLCRIEALKYGSNSDFIKNSYAAYVAASKNNWLKDICVHMKICHNILLRCVYAYEFSDKHVYIGLTCNVDRRKHEHKKTKKSPVLKHIKKTELKPKFILLNDYTKVKNAQFLENKFCENYKKLGWTLLNSRKTGGLGSHSIYNILT